MNTALLGTPGVKISSQYFEKRETDAGIQFVPVVSLSPGVDYYIRCIDNNNQEYFSPAQDPLSTPFAISVNSVPDIESSYTHSEIYNVQSLHLGICITSLFIIGLPFLIGFPFCRSKFKNIADKSNNITVKSMVRAYEGVGWTAWLLHLACPILVVMLLFQFLEAIAYDGRGNGPGIPIFVPTITIGILTFVFTLSVVVIGCTILSMLLVKKNGSYANESHIKEIPNLT